MVGKCVKRRKRKKLASNLPSIQTTYGNSGIIAIQRHMKRKNWPTFGKETLVMGILNVTPDSFSDGGEYFNNTDKAVDRAQQMIAQGADIIDIGAESTRPNAESVSKEEELTRVIPVIQKIRKVCGENICISIDTYKSHVAKEAVQAGADMVNDVSGLQMDKDMAKTVGMLQVPVVINHMRGTPQTMQKEKIAYKDVVADIISFFQEKIALLQQSGVTKENIILDPGFGFGKTVTYNIQILKRFNEFTTLGFPTLIGISRKNTLGILLQETFKTNAPLPITDRLEAGLAASAIAVLNGTNILRTHDVLQTKKFLSVLDKIKTYEN